MVHSITVETALAVDKMLIFYKNYHNIREGEHLDFSSFVLK